MICLLDMHSMVCLSFQLNALLLWSAWISSLLSGSFIINTAAVTTNTPLGGSETDHLALQAFKAKITQDPFGVMASWNDSLHFCFWEGVSCINPQHSPRVVTLDLQSSGLVGSIAPEIGNLSFIRQIWLRNNSFHGEIPQQIGRLFRIQVLVLSSNSLEGQIPGNLSRCSNLKILSLSWNNLTGKIPTELGTLLKLEVLRVQNNNLMGEIPPSLGNLSSLVNLTAQYNSLEGGIPGTIGRLQRLQMLLLGENRLSGMVPPSLFNLSSLINFYVEGNRLKGNLPHNIGLTLPNIHEITLGENQFTGTIPVSLSNASKLEWLQLRNNSFIGRVSIDFRGLHRLRVLTLGLNYLGSGEMDDLSFINTMTNCSILEGIGLEMNQFGGFLPSSLGNLSTQFSELTLGSNQISGSFPSGIENYVNLVTLGLEQNIFTGELPSSIGKLQQLSTLSLGGNMFSGQLPSSLGNLTRLSILGLEMNNFSGSIPPLLGKCHYLLSLGLSQNTLTGSIPRELFDLSSSLITLDLSQNRLVGSLPSEIGKLTSLGVLDVSENRLSGEIPNTLSSCTSLENMLMQGNHFSGSIPTSLNSLRGLEYLDLSRNNLSGPIPKYLQELRFLLNLNLSFNNLEGEVPTNGVFGNASAISIVGNNKLCGGVSSLKLPACSIQTSERKGTTHHSFKLVLCITIVGVTLCLISISILLILFLKKRQKKEHSSESSVGNHHLMISYEELLKATGGFNSSNLIGVGSFGSVYKGTLEQCQTIVAVKVINLQQRGASKSFLAECEAWRNIRHRNLVKIITSCSSADFKGNDFKAVVYEFMSNGNLDKWLHQEEINHDQVEPRRHLNILQRLNIAIDVASALDYLHHHCQVAVIHCDLKPSNILLDDNLTAHVGDFGLSRFLLEMSKRSSLSQSSSVGIKGSIGYAAPEYGVGAAVSTHADMYSYGILLLEMFTGKRPTNEMFKDGLDLHNIAKMASPDKVWEILDPSLLFSQGKDGEEETEVTNATEQCLISVVKVGVSCSMPSPRERMDAREAVKELQLIREIYLGLRTHGTNEMQ
ncbi:PREDICTED: putative receptor-like protein kinase At3g47110 [Nelumbo nucifera]|uniref:non-specific serine/threonine protein kinase n=2 Tax=Nelumbo nucifera TaxID=4432 RepID=A0A822Y1A8_NELNU|nr:PREDICTED: putative receptor-like protein kinase At3g47110 [Nelumbo nucifera]DAD25301.1 TPA_asm: hypothetical protein HUJ06_026765 [Nelumbo nucifera]